MDPVPRKKRAARKKQKKVYDTTVKKKHYRFIDLADKQVGVQALSLIPGICCGTNGHARREANDRAAALVSARTKLLDERNRDATTLTIEDFRKVTYPNPETQKPKLAFDSKINSPLKLHLDIVQVRQKTNPVRKKCP